MYKIKIPLTHLCMNNKKIKTSNLNKVLTNNIILKSYDYIDTVHVLYKTSKHNGHPHTIRSLEIICTKELTKKSVKSLSKN